MEAQDKIARQERIINILTGAVATNMSYPKGLTWLGCAEEIDKVYKQLGYHKPLDRPELRVMLGQMDLHLTYDGCLSDKDIRRILALIQPQGKPPELCCGDDHCQPYCHETQLKSDIKFYGGE